MYNWDTEGIGDNGMSMNIIEMRAEIKEKVDNCINAWTLKSILEELKRYEAKRENERNKPYSIKDASQLLEVSTDDVMELIDNGTLKADKDNNIAADDFRKYMNEYFGYEA